MNSQDLQNFTQRKSVTVTYTMQVLKLVYNIHALITPLGVSFRVLLSYKCYTHNCINYLVSFGIVLTYYSVAQMVRVLRLIFET